jgi:outer membrane receptor for Fe3+-dicitrate
LLPITVIANLCSQAQTNSKQMAKPMADTVLLSVQKDHWGGVKKIGFDEQPNRYVTSAISTVGGTDLEKTYTFNAGNTLFGRLPGLTVQQGGSEPGAAVPTLRVRGINTIGSNFNGDPLIIVDGYIINGNATANGFMQMVPEEIESISVLRCWCYCGIWPKGCKRCATGNHQKWQ